MRAHQALQRELDADVAAVTTLLTTLNGGCMPKGLQESQRPEVVCAVLKAFVGAASHLPEGWMNHRRPEEDR